MNTLKSFMFEKFTVFLKKKTKLLILVDSVKNLLLKNMS